MCGGMAVPMSELSGFDHLKMAALQNAVTFSAELGDKAEDVTKTAETFLNFLKTGRAS